VEGGPGQVKLEIEISEDEIRDAIARKVRVAIADQTNQWSVDEFIRNTVKKYWQEVADKMVRDCLAESETMRSKIVEAVERKLKSQVAALMKDRAK
jgi:hypothetical protein